MNVSKIADGIIESFYDGYYAQEATTLTLELMQIVNDDMRAKKANENRVHLGELAKNININKRMIRSARDLGAI